MFGKIEYTDHRRWLNNNADNIRILLKNMFKCPGTFPMYAFGELNASGSRQVLTNCVEIKTSSLLLDESNLSIIGSHLDTVISKDRDTLVKKGANLEGQIKELLILTNIKLANVVGDHTSDEVFEVLKSDDAKILFPSSPKGSRLNSSNASSLSRRGSADITAPLSRRGSTELNSSLSSIRSLTWPTVLPVTMAKFASATLMMEHVKLTLEFLKHGVDTSLFDEVVRRRNDLIVVFMIISIEKIDKVLTKEAQYLLDLKYCTLRFATNVIRNELPTILWTDRGTVGRQQFKQKNMCTIQKPINIERDYGINDSGHKKVKTNIVNFFKFLNENLTGDICIKNLLNVSVPNKFYNDLRSSTAIVKSFQELVDLLNFAGNLRAYQGLYHKLYPTDIRITAFKPTTRIPKLFENGDLTHYPVILAYVVKVNNVWMIKDMKRFMAYFNEPHDAFERSFSLIDEWSNTAYNTLIKARHSDFVMYKKMPTEKDKSMGKTEMEIKRILTSDTVKAAIENKDACGVKLDLFSDSDIKQFIDPMIFNAEQDYKDLLCRRKLVTETCFSRCYDELSFKKTEQKIVFINDKTPTSVY